MSETNVPKMGRPRGSLTETFDYLAKTEALPKDIPRIDGAINLREVIDENSQEMYDLENMVRFAACSENETIARVNQEALKIGSRGLIEDISEKEGKIYIYLKYGKKPLQKVYVCDILYTKPESEFSYSGEYPDMPEFQKPWEHCIQVGQGHGKTSSDGRPLESEGFSKCIALILKNKKTAESQLFHVDDIDLRYDYYRQQTLEVEKLMKNYLESKNLSVKEKEIILPTLHEVCTYDYPKRMKREEFQTKMEEINSDGTIKGKIISGTLGRYWIRTRIEGSLLGYLGIKIEDTIMVDTEKNHWDILYKPKESLIYANARYRKKVLAFKF